MTREIFSPALKHLHEKPQCVSHHCFHFIHKNSTYCCRNLVHAHFLVQCPCVIPSIWSLQMTTSTRASTLFMTKPLLKLSAKFSRSTNLVIWLSLLSLIYRSLIVTNLLFLLLLVLVLFLLLFIFFLRIYIYIFCRHALLFEDMGGEYNIPLAAHAKSIRDFDDGLTRGM